MKKILTGSGKKVGTVFSDMDTNFIGVLNMLLKLVHPDFTLKGYADNGSEPAAPAANDCWLVLADGTVWGETVEEGEFIYWNGTAWAVWSYKTSELYYPLLERIESDLGLAGSSASGSGSGSGSG